MPKLFALLATLILACLPLPLAAKVQLTFHSFNGSWIGRYPHTFVSLEGTLDATGRRISENYGYSAVSASPAVLAGSVDGYIATEPAKYVRSTNHHFSVWLSDEQYQEIISEVARWRDAPGKDYNLNRNNCVHFVAAVARLVGLRADVPQTLVRKPKLWLNYVARLNPELGAKEIK